MVLDNKKGGDNIGRLLLMEFKEQDSAVFEEVMAVLKSYPDLKKCV